MEEGRQLEKGIAWCIDVPIFRNSLILKQLGIALGIPFGILILLLVFWALKSQSRDALFALGLLGVLLLLSWGFIMVLYRGNYAVEYFLNDSGVRCQTEKVMGRKNRVVNLLTVFLGLFSGRLTAAGAGMLAQSRQDVFLKWGKIRKVKNNPRNYTIQLWGGWTEQLALFCTADNYAQIEQIVQAKTKLEI